MRKVLLIDDDPGTLVGYGCLLTDAGFHVLAAKSANEGLSIARTQHPDVVVSDLRLPDLSGVDLLRTLRSEGYTMPFAIVTGFASIESAIDGIHLGIADYVEKPLIGEDIVRVVERLLSREPRSAPEAHAASRWASTVVAVLDSPYDPKSLHLWSKYVAASPGAIKNWCFTAGVSPRRTLVFARLLRVVLRRRYELLRVQDLLDVVDIRTLSQLLKLGGSMTGRQEQFPTTVDEYLTRQSLIHDKTLIDEVRRALASRGIL